jgi:hypothetical protein
MRNFIYLTIFFVFAFTSAQSKFKKGYIVDNNMNKIECYIKNLNWLNNPNEIFYKTDINDIEIKATIEDLNSFGIENEIKYLRAKVKIDQTLMQLNELKFDKEPILQEELVFLKVLTEGKANLYYYVASNKKTSFFFNQFGQPIEPLIYKIYKSENSSVRENNHYKQQLKNALKCSSISDDNLNRLKYNSESLINLFNSYNFCVDPNFQKLNTSKSFFEFRLNLRPGVTFNQYKSVYTFLNSNIKNFIGFRIGLESEFNLNFDMNRWSALLEPTYHNLKGKDNQGILPSGNKFTTDLNLSSFEVPIGVRYYLLLNENASIYFNGFIKFIFVNNLITNYKYDDGTTLRFENETKTTTFNYGVGYRFKEKYFMEIRYQPRYNLYPNQTFDGIHSSFEFILGYRLF